MPSRKRPVYLVVEYLDPTDEENSPYHVVEIKQTSLAAEVLAAKRSSWKVRKGFVTA